MDINIIKRKIFVAFLVALIFLSIIIIANLTVGIKFRFTYVIFFLSFIIFICIGVASLKSKQMNHWLMSTWGCEAAALAISEIAYSYYVKNNDLRIQYVWFFILVIETVVSYFAGKKLNEWEFRAEEEKSKKSIKNVANVLPYSGVLLYLILCITGNFFPEKGKNIAHIVLMHIFIILLQVGAFHCHFCKIRKKDDHNSDSAC